MADDEDTIKRVVIEDAIDKLRTTKSKQFQPLRKYLCVCVCVCMQSMSACDHSLSLSSCLPIPAQAHQFHSGFKSEQQSECIVGIIQSTIKVSVGWKVLHHESDDVQKNSHGHLQSDR